MKALSGRLVTGVCQGDRVQKRTLNQRKVAQTHRLHLRTTKRVLWMPGNCLKMN